VCIVVDTEREEPPMAINRDKMIARALKQGMDIQSAEERLEEVLSTFAEKNIPAALAYWGFISDYTAEKLQLQG